MDLNNSPMPKYINMNMLQFSLCTVDTTPIINKTNTLASYNLHDLI